MLIAIHTTNPFAFFDIGFSVDAMLSCQRVINRFHAVYLIARRKRRAIHLTHTNYLSTAHGETRHLFLYF